MISLRRRTRPGATPQRPVEARYPLLGTDRPDKGGPSAEQAKTRGALSRAFVESDPDFARGLRKMTVAQRNYVLIQLAMAERRYCAGCGGPLPFFCQECKDGQCVGKGCPC